MNRNIGTDPNRMLGATISANNATYGLAPARPAGPHETVSYRWPRCSAPTFWPPCRSGAAR